MFSSYNKMEKINIIAITNDFDEFVSGHMQKKQIIPTILPLPKQLKQVESKPGDPMFLGNLIKQGIQKRMKLKPPDATQKFQNMLKPFKKLQSFISIKDFLEKVSDCQYYLPQSKMLTSQKKQNQETLSQYYNNKIQQHLRNKNYQRKIGSQAEWLLFCLQQNPTKNNEYTKWMQEMLQNTNTKDKNSVFNGEFLYKQLTEEKQQYPPESFSLNIDKSSTRNKSVGSKIGNINNTQKKFCKITNYLSSRLKRMLINKYCDQSSYKRQLGKASIYSNTKNIQKQSFSTTDLNRPSTTTSSKIRLKKDYINQANEKMHSLLQIIQDQLSKTGANTTSITRLNRIKPATAKTRLL